MGGVVDLTLAGGALAAALVYWLRFAARDEVSAGGAAVKAASTGLLAVTPWLLALGFGIPALWPVALGLTLGAVGDWFLARKGKATFLAGMAAFGAGHLAYAGGMLAYGIDRMSAGEAAVAAGLIGLIVSTEVWLAPRTKALRWPVRGYVVLIGAMGLALVVLPAGEGRGMLRLGGALFVLSDLMLALRLFVVADPAWQRRLSLMLWPAYWCGQALIAYAAIPYWIGQAG